MSTWALEVAERPGLLLDFDGKIEHLREELARSEVDRLSLRQELQQKNKQLRELLQSPDESLHYRAAQFSELKEQLAGSEMKLIGSNLALDKKAAEAKYMGEFIRTLEDQLVNYQQKMFSLQEESVQLRRELAGHEARQTEIYLRLERQLDDWLNEKALLESRVGDMQGQLVLSVGAIQGVLPLPNTGEGFEGANELTQESQGLVQTLLELGEAFLASKIGEDEFQELQAKLIAAKTRDYEIIRDLQLKIGELSEMGAMVAQLKAELREEKEKAREDAEDLTQEMAELRYQLMQMLDHERELRAHTEQASLRRISELEEQLKRSRQETIAASSQIQSAQIQAERSAVEIKHLKVALEESRQKHSSLVSAKEGIEGKLRGQIEELQAKVVILEMDACKAKEENAERILNTSGSYSTEVELDVASLEYGVSEARQLLADFKQHICLLGQEYYAAQKISQEERASQSIDLENHRASDVPTFRESREREELVLRAENLQVKLEELEEELQEENEEHVEVLIRYEEERSLMEADLEVARKALSALCIDFLQISSSSTKNFPSWTAEEINSRSVRELSKVVMELRHRQNGSLYRSHIDSLSNEFNIETQGIMVSYNGNSDERALLSFYTADMEQEISRKEVEVLRQELQIAENKLLALNQRERMLEDSMKKQEGKMREQEQLLESLLEERMDTSLSEDNSNAIFDQRYRRQDEEYHELMMRNTELLNNLEVLRTMLSVNQSRESEIRAQFQKSELELSIAKEEVFKSEVRLQKVSKQAMERIDAEKRKLQEAVNAHRQREWSLTKQLESLHKFEHDKMEILSLVEQLKLSCERAERERDELKAAYTELESQFSKRRSLLLGR